MLKNILIIFIIILLAFWVYWFFTKSSLRYPLPKTATKIHLKKYMGVWYEIALLPNRFEKGCVCTKAVYTLEEKQIVVQNSCYKKDKRKYTMIKGKAWAIDQSNSKLKVQFYWPFKGDYWILYVDEHYKYALVGSPSRQYLWILARETTMPKNEYDKLVSIARNQGYPIDSLVKTAHDCQNR